MIEQDLAYLICKCGEDARAEIGDYPMIRCPQCGRTGCWVEYAYDPEMIRRQAIGLDIKRVLDPHTR